MAPARRASSCNDGRVAVLRDDLDRRIVRLAIPALGTLAVEPLYVLVDTAIVGRIGTAQLAGLAVAATVLLTILGLATFLEYGVTPDVAFAHGAGRPDDARRAATDALALAIGIGTLAGMVLAVVARPTAWLLGGRGRVLDNAELYLRISAIGLPCVLVALVGHGVMRGLNDLRKPLLIVLVANVANVVMELIAVYGLHLGIAGSAWSTVIVQIGAAIWFVRVLLPHTARSTPAWERYRPMLVAGRHLAVRSIAMYAVWNSTTLIAAAHRHAHARRQPGARAAVHGAVPRARRARRSRPSRSSPARSARATSTRPCASARPAPGSPCGARSASPARSAATSTVLPAVFSGDGAVRSRLTTGLLILAVMQLPGAVAFALDGALIGAHDERFLGRIAVVNLVAFAPLAVATFIAPGLGLLGLWGAQLCWMSMRATVNHRRWRSRVWAHPRLVGARA